MNHSVAEMILAPLFPRLEIRGLLAAELEQGVARERINRLAVAHDRREQCHTPSRIRPRSRTQASLLVPPTVCSSVRLPCTSWSKSIMPELLDELALVVSDQCGGRGLAPAGLVLGRSRPALMVWARAWSRRNGRVSGLGERLAADPARSGVPVRPPAVLGEPDPHPSPTSGFTWFVGWATAAAADSWPELHAGEQPRCPLPRSPHPKRSSRPHRPGRRLRSSFASRNASASLNASRSSITSGGGSLVGDAHRERRSWAGPPRHPMGSTRRL